MKHFFSIILFLSVINIIKGQTIYQKAFGSATGNAIIFLHGGPGYNCANFEGTTAQELADKGLFVIVYDRRGEGRSNDTHAKFTFRQSFDDLDTIYKTYNLTKATLIGHSFGGIVATLFAEMYPWKVKSVVLVGAPVSLQQSFQNILIKAESIYRAKNDSTNLGYVAMLKKMDTASLEYSSYNFMHAMKNGFYTPKKPTDEAKNIYSKFRSDTLLKKYAAAMSYEAPLGFWKNEKYTTLDLTKDLIALKEKNVRIYGLYDKEDGLYSVEQINSLRNIIGYKNLDFLDNCSHNVFIDQQAHFLAAVTKWVK